eukprot:628460-Rhodomonas_salina.1
MSIVMGLEVLLRHCSSSLRLMHEMIFFESAAGLVRSGKRFVFSQAFALVLATGCSAVGCSVWHEEGGVVCCSGVVPLWAPVSADAS